MIDLFDLIFIRLMYNLDFFEKHLQTYAKRKEVFDLRNVYHFVIQKTCYNQVFFSLFMNEFI